MIEDMQAGEHRRSRRTTNGIRIKPIHFQTIFCQLINIWGWNKATVIGNVSPTQIISENNYNIWFVCR